MDAETEGGRVLVNIAVGRAYMDTGSNAALTEGDRLVEAERCDEDLDAILISLARDCRDWEAIAKVVKVLSGWDVGLAAPVPLPLRAPLFRLLLVEVDLDVVSSTSRSASLSSSSLSWSMTVDSSSLSYAGPKEGARERERACIAGVVRAAAVQPDAFREEGRRDKGVDNERRWP